MQFGTYEASYDNLPRMLSQVATRNPGSFYDIYLVTAVTAELVKVRVSGTSTSQAAEARDSIEKPFSHWI